MLFEDAHRAQASSPLAWIGVTNYSTAAPPPSYTTTLLPSVVSTSTAVVLGDGFATFRPSGELFSFFQALKGAALAILVLWTIVANSLVFIVLYKNPRLQTVPNLLVGNLAFSDLCLAIIVLPLSAIYVLAGEWLFPELLCEVFVSADILCSTASIWNLSIVGLDRYWAITTPVAYMAKRNKQTASLMILSVWSLAVIISLAPLLGWKQVKINNAWQCTFLDLPSYTIYSATGSFFIPTLLMFFVYFKIYQAFAKHRARQIYRQKVIRKHIESTILHEISHVLPTSDEFAKDEEEDEDDEDDDESGSSGRRKSSSVNHNHSSRGMAGEEDISQIRNGVIVEEDEEAYYMEEEEEEENHEAESDSSVDEERRSGGGREGISHAPTYSIAREALSAPAATTAQTSTSAVLVNDTVVVRKNTPGPLPSALNHHSRSPTSQQQPVSWNGRGVERNAAFKHQRSSSGEEDSELAVARFKEDIRNRTNNNNVTINSPMKRSTDREWRKEPTSRAVTSNTAITYEKVKRHKQRKERRYRKSLQCKPRAISAAKERRGVKVLGIILGAYCCCWTPFFIMYMLAQFCSKCQLNPHIEMFITWLGYINSAMNPIIYTVFNRDYQIALKRIFTQSDKSMLAPRPSVL